MTARLPRRLALFFLTLSFLLPSTPSSAAWGVSESWAVNQGVGHCTATRNYGPSRVEISLWRDRRQDNVVLQIYNKSFRWPNSVTEIDVKSKKANYNAANSSGYVDGYPLSNERSFMMRYPEESLSDLAETGSLTLYFNGKMQGSFSMVGGANAITLLKACVDQVNQIARKHGVEGQLSMNWSEGAKSSFIRQAVQNNKQNRQEGSTQLIGRVAPQPVSNILSPSDHQGYANGCPFPATPNFVPLPTEQSEAYRQRMGPHLNQYMIAVDKMYYDCRRAALGVGPETQDPDWKIKSQDLIRETDEIWHPVSAAFFETANCLKAAPANPACADPSRIALRSRPQPRPTSFRRYDTPRVIEEPVSRSPSTASSWNQTSRHINELAQDLLRRKLAQGSAGSNNSQKCQQTLAQIASDRRSIQSMQEAAQGGVGVQQIEDMMREGHHVIANNQRWYDQNCR